MQEERIITFYVNRKKINLDTGMILYTLMVGRVAEIHVSGGAVYRKHMTMAELGEALGDGFIKAHRGCFVSARAIHKITDVIHLNNGETLVYTLRKRAQIVGEFRRKQRSIIQAFAREGIPGTPEEYRDHYRGLEHLPIAFTDIEMIFNEERHAVDWVFRYGNAALAKLEKIPLETLIGRSFGSLFPNMDSKWLGSYERAALYGETLEIMDYSPEIDTYLKVICFPTFKGHCGCFLFDLSRIRYTRISPDAAKVLALYLKEPEETPGEA